MNNACELNFYKFLKILVIKSLKKQVVFKKYIYKKLEGLRTPKIT